jgi:hypothetical protein
MGRVGRSDRWEETKAKSSKATSAEAAQICPTTSAYGGRYKIDGGKLIVDPEVASSPAPSVAENSDYQSIGVASYVASYIEHDPVARDDVR